jgi:hypothetical protein
MTGAAKDDLAALWRTLRAVKPGIRARDAATELGVSEAELVATMASWLPGFLASWAAGGDRAAEGSGDASETARRGARSHLDDILADVLDSDPQLLKFYNLRRKVMRTSAEQQDYLAMISDPKLLAAARKDLLDAFSGAEVDQRDELKRLQRIQYMNSALAWEDNPEGCGSFTTADSRVILVAWIAMSRLQVRRDGNCRSLSATASGTRASLGAGFLVENRPRQAAKVARQQRARRSQDRRPTDRNCSRFAPSQKSRTQSRTSQGTGSCHGCCDGEPPDRCLEACARVVVWR